MKLFCMFLCRIAFLFNFYILHFDILGEHLDIFGCGCTAVLATFPLTYIKGAPSCPRQFLETEDPLKMMKNAFYFT